MKTREGEKNACEPVRSQPEVTDIELRRMCEGMEEMICEYGSPLPHSGQGGFMYSLSRFGSCSGLCKTPNKVGIRLFCGLWEGFYPLGPQ